MELRQLVGSKSSRKSNKEVNFEYAAPSARRVFLVGTFNDWSQEACPLRKGKSGKWSTTLSLAPGRYEYRYFVDGVWECDPEPKECVPNPFGSWNCVVNVD